MSNENASSTHPEDLAEAMHLLELAHVAARHALHAAQDAEALHEKTPDDADRIDALQALAGRSRQRAAEKAEAACRIMARLAALRD